MLCNFDVSRDIFEYHLVHVSKIRLKEPFSCIYVTHETFKFFLYHYITLVCMFVSNLAAKHFVIDIL